MIPIIEISTTNIKMWYFTPSIPPPIMLMIFSEGVTNHSDHLVITQEQDREHESIEIHQEVLPGLGHGTHPHGFKINGEIRL
jgi:hypothetical protein